jgi:hypothetical protein
MRPLTPYPELDFVDGPPVGDDDALANWLAAHDGDRRQLRLPVSMDNLGIAVANFVVGHIAIHVDDTALGVSLADRVRAKSEGQARLQLWLEGYWSAGTLHLRRVGDRVGEETVRAAIEADKPEGEADS